MPKPEGVGKAAKPAKAPKVAYTVTIDGTEHQVENGGDLKDLLLETLTDGAAHTVTVVEVERPEEVEETPVV